MKKIALLASAALLSSAAMADAPTATGFYAGVNAGLANTNVKYNVQNVGATAALTQNYNVDAGKLGLQYGLFGGYNAALGGGAVVGVELFVGGDSSKVKVMDDNSGQSLNLGKENVKRTLYYGLAPRVGVMLTPNVLAYVRLGVEGGKWKAEYIPDAATVNAGAGAATPAQLAAAKLTKTANKNKISFAPGFGLDVFASKNMFLRAQYHYVFGPKLKIEWPEVAALTGGAVFNGSNQIRKYNVTQHVFSVAVGYKF